METSRGEWLTRQIERRRITVRQLADALDVATQTVYNWQSGKSVINEERVPRLAAALGVSELEARRGLGLWVPEEQTADFEQGYELGRNMDDATVLKLLETIDNRLLLTELARRLNSR